MSNAENIMQNEELIQKLAEAESPAALAALLAENGFELEEGLTVEKVYETLKNPEAATDELNADDLDDVSGGLAILPIGGPILSYLLIKEIAKRTKKGCTFKRRKK